MSKVKEVEQEEAEVPVAPVEPDEEVDLLPDDNTDEEDIDIDDVDIGAVLGALEEAEEKIETLESRVESMDKAFFSCLRGLVMLVDELETVVNPLSQPEAQARALTQVQETLATMSKFLKEK